MTRIHELLLARGPQGEFTSVDAAAEHACGVRPDGEAVCWNVDSFGKATVPDTSRYISVSIGGGHACGINGMRELVCWGENYTDYGEKTAPWPRFVYHHQRRFSSHLRIET